MNKVLLVAFICWSSSSYCQKVHAKVDAGAHLIKTTNWLLFHTETISVENIDGTNMRVYTTTSPRPTNPGAMYVEGIDQHFPQGTSVIVYVYKPMISLLSTLITSAKVTAVDHLIANTDWSKFQKSPILVEETDGRNQHIYSTTNRAINPNAMIRC
jgi:hypothetical protein